MATGNAWLLYLLSACFLISRLACAHESSLNCEDLGFTGLALCSDCDSLAEFVKDEELISECRACCAQEGEDSITKITYSGAILEVCMRKLVFYPNVQSFIEDDLPKYLNIKVQYRYGSPPKLIMLDEDGNNKETIRIDNWKKEHIEQFLKEKVKGNLERYLKKESTPRFASLTDFVSNPKKFW
ncbi:hypothetical protein GOP47_0004851 [Adiantum capillus-veneris]|uniref:Selenoprotein F n=1 Tax=Adiantum capillus-veneris TaxID=13818 RepID=A0A9D4ZMN4_ADICA|nr:hypothetical protein GOP47_0004851 [Adiantum capillus-veneris]